MGRDGLAGEITVGAEHGAASRIALAVGGRFSLTGDKCIPNPGIGSRCLPKYPTLAHVGVLVGVGRKVSAGEFRVLAGPAVYGGSGSSGLGVQCQLDAAVGFSRIAVVFAAGGSAVARLDGEKLYLGSMGVGLRLR